MHVHSQPRDNTTSHNQEEEFANQVQNNQEGIYSLLQPSDADNDCHNVTVFVFKLVYSYSARESNANIYIIYEWHSKITFDYFRFMIIEHNSLVYMHVDIA